MFVLSASVFICLFAGLHREEEWGGYKSDSVIEVDTGILFTPFS